MIKDIVIGSKRDNVISKIRESRVAKLLLFGSWLYLYELFLKGKEMQIEAIIVVAVLGIVIVNLLYMPVRMLFSSRIDFDIKLIFTTIAIIIIMYYANLTEEFSLKCFFENTIEMIIGSLIVTGLCVSVYKWMAVHSQKGKNIKYGTNIDQMDGHDFEYFCADMLRKKGFHKVEVTQGSGDYGIDVIAYDNKGIKWGIQCKRYNGNVGWHAIEEAHAGGAYYKCGITAVMTNSRFTKQAIEGAGALGVLLFDGEWLKR